ncbi:MAG: SsrA-binding protein SmpB [Erysipelothrix sp.]|nr:SsrA-binding protein SmpB [Erysipelothrix sp.]
MKILANNKRANYDYFLEDKFEAGIVLSGSEVKSIKNAQLSLAEAYVDIINNEVYLREMHVAQYREANQFNHTEVRNRKLLLNKREINKLMGSVSQAGYTIVPTKVYVKHGMIKVEIALAKGKANYDKRETIKKREVDRELRARLKQY